MSTFTLADLERVMRSLPPDPIAPENRNYARLQPSAHVPRGQMYRLAPQPHLTGHQSPMIVMNIDDVQALRVWWAELPLGRFANNDQRIADCAEQLFAEQEAKGL